MVGHKTLRVLTTAARVHTVPVAQNNMPLEHFRLKRIIITYKLKKFAFTFTFRIRNQYADPDPEG